ncbi:MAG: hypothetical protein AABY18_09060 [Candidatus Thermoplasmatota archaeon]
MQRPVLDLVRPSWPPLRHVERGWQALRPAERRRVEARLTTVLGRLQLGAHGRDSLVRLFAFLAQVETIAIEIPLRALAGAPPAQAKLLRAQLTDEVFHSALFARLAHDLALPAAQPPPPIAAAERLLQRIRDEPDAAVAATLLNLVAEAWIETLFRHARSWGIADAVFDSVLADEERHVEEAFGHLSGFDAATATPAVRTLEQGLLEVGADPAVALAMLDLAGPDGYRRLADDLEANHRAQLAKVGLQPSPSFDALRPLRESLSSPLAQPQAVADTPWRRAARSVWSNPRDPTMQGAMDVRVGHVPKRLLTPVFVAAIARAWARNPRLNRVVSRGRVWQLPRINVGVRVLVADDELATVVVPDANERSVHDIARLIADGHGQLLRLREARLQAVAEGKPAPEPLADGLDALVAPGPATFSVAVSNVGKFGLESGAGAFSGPLSPSSDLTIGRRHRSPHWAGVAYVPAWTVTVGCLQDHRVFDGREAGLGMSAIRDELSPSAVRRLLREPGTLPADDGPAQAPAWMAALPPELRALPAVGLWKYAPVVVGGAALVAALGVGGFVLAQQLGVLGAGAAAGAAASSSAATTAGVPAAAAGGAASAPLAAGLVPLADPFTNAPGLCQAVVPTGHFCTGPANASSFCDAHGG